MAALDSSTFLVIIKQQRMGDSSPPPLSGGTYLLRFAGILRKPTNLVTSAEGRGLTPDRILDLLYPGAHDVSRAMGVAVEEGQTLPNLHVRIPRPVRHRVKGRVIGVLPPERKYMSIQFRRELGALDQAGWAGGAVIQPDGQFEGLEQPGRYYAEICQFTPPGPSGRTCLVRSLGSTTFTIGSEDLSGIEIQVARDASEKQSS